MRVAVSVVLSVLLVAGQIRGAVLPVTNPGFENIAGQQVYNEFTFGVPVGWTLHDPNAIVAQPEIYVGTLRPNGTQFFPTLAPEGERVAILFNSGREGLGEYGFTQTLTATLQPNTTYVLSVLVGNIASGTAVDGTFFNLDEFPGYRVDLLAGGVPIASDNDQLQLAEGEWGTSIVTSLIGSAHPQLGLLLGIRLVNLNQIPAGHTAGTSPDLEVDFDRVLLTNFPVIPEPGPAGALLFATAGGLLARHRRTAAP